MFSMVFDMEEAYKKSLLFFKEGLFALLFCLIIESLESCWHI